MPLPTNKEIAKTPNNLRHGDAGTRFYKRWAGMKSRCGHKTRLAYTNISYCKRWEKYLNFKEDMFESYNNHAKQFGIRNTTLDRIDSSGNYEPKNCKWATYKEQENNRNVSYMLNYRGKTQNLTDWAKELTLNEKTLRSRIWRGWRGNKILEVPIRKLNFK